MLQNYDGVMQLMNAPIRTIEGRLYYYAGGGTSGATLRHNNYLKSFSIERVGEDGKFFGFGICQKATVKIRDDKRIWNMVEGDVVRPLYVDKSADTAATYFPYPKFIVKEAKRDENTNEITLTSYDAIYKANSHTISELELPESFTIKQFVAKCAEFLGTNSYRIVINGDEAVFNLRYTLGENGNVNFEGTETIRSALNAVAEVTQTIYYCDKLNSLCFTRLDKDGDAVLTIDKTKYFTLESKGAKTLSNIVHSTELGDNIGTVEGLVQYVNNNPFWELRVDISTLVEIANDEMCGVSIEEINCNWRGNTLLEIGDKIALITKDDNIIYSYVLNDVVTYDGALSETTQWNYKEAGGDAHANPTNLGEALMETYAKVDKVNKTIEMVVSESGANAANITELKLSTEGIGASVEKFEKSIDSITGDIATLNEKVDVAVTANDVTIAIQKEMANGTNKVTTNTGYVFDDTGLTVSKTDSEMKTTITDDGMRVYKNDEEVLTADNSGVSAKNLHANTYLIIGNYSRLEDYGNRTGCFWIGG